jgi:hypothetical protein
LIRDGLSVISDRNSTQLGNWLAAMFPHVYVDGAFYDAASGDDQKMELAGKKNPEIAEVFQFLHQRNKKTAVAGSPPKVDAQVMVFAGVMIKAVRR